LSRDLDEDGAISRYDEILIDFKNYAANRFEWTGLPSGLTSERLETMLLEKGQLMCYKRKGFNTKNGIMILPCYPTNRMTVYGEYDKYNIYGYNGETDIVNLDDGIRIKNNPLCSNNIDNLMKYAKRIDDIEMTQDVNLFQQNVPKIILADEGGRLTAKFLMKAIREFKFVVFGKKTLTSQLSQSDVLDTTAPYLLDKLQDHKNNLVNEVLTYLGINNNSTDKKERLIVDEVNANNDIIAINLDLMFDLRERACKEINEKFNLNMTVKKRRNEDVEIHNDNGGSTEE